MKLALLFPGQGAQKVGMGKDVFDTSEPAREVFRTADRELGFELSRLCFEGPEQQLTLTANTQPAIVTTSLALLAALRHALPDLPAVEAAAGHSLGEYAALVAAGALSLNEAVRLVRLRGEAMQSAVAEGEGGMLAVIGAEAAAVESLCQDAREADVLSPANFNCPGQIVISGSKLAIDRAQVLAKQRGLKAIALKVSAPFHCALMRPAAEHVALALKTIHVGPLAFDVFSNVEGRANSDSARVPELLVRQIDGAVLWEQTLRGMLSAGITHALELGPGQVLAGLAKKTDKSLKVLSVQDAAGIQLVPEFLAS